MIIRLKNTKNEISDYLVPDEEFDYWADTEKMQLMVRIDGRARVAAKTKVYKKLQAGLDRIHDRLEKDPAFLDLTDIMK